MKDLNWSSATHLRWINHKPMETNLLKFGGDQLKEAKLWHLVGSDVVKFLSHKHSSYYHYKHMKLARHVEHWWKLSCLIDLQVSPLTYDVLPKSHILVVYQTLEDKVKACPCRYVGHSSQLVVEGGGGTQRARHPQYIMSLLLYFENHDFLYWLKVLSY